MFLVTGASGFIGKNLISELVKITKVRIFARRTSNIDLFKDNKNIEVRYGELETDVGIADALNGIDVVIHCAARTIGRGFIEYYRTNAKGTANLIEAMERKNICKIIYLSSQAACGPSRGKIMANEAMKPVPISFYGLSKKIAEDILIRSNLKFIILRAPTVYGPYDMEILKYIKLINSGICPIVGFREKYISLIYAADLVELIIKIIKEDLFNNKIYFTSDGNFYSFNDVLNEITKILGRHIFKIYIPKSAGMLVGMLNDLFLPEKKRFIWRDKIKELASECWLCSNEQLTKDIGFIPKYSLKDGMSQTINWYKAFGFIK